MSDQFATTSPPQIFEFSTTSPPQIFESTTTSPPQIFESTDTKMSISRETTDSVVFSVVQQFLQRADFGFKKYGTNLDRTDLSVLDWIQHAQEEHMDAILYLEKLKQEYSKKSDVENSKIYGGEAVEN